MNIIALPRAIVYSALSLLTLGCHSGTEHVQGTVTMNDSATQDGYVTFLCVDKDRPVFIANLNIVNGHYNSKADGISLPHGNYQVRVAITKKTGRQVPMPGRPDNKMQDELIVLSSEEYNGPKSPLKYEVVESSTYNIEVPAEKESHARAL